MDKGDAVGNGFKPFPTLEDETKELMKYFFIGLALPNEKFWVNLRPDSPDNILDPDLEKTDIGRILLEADLQLKKDTSGMTSPQTKEGREYWDNLYKKAGELFGTENITIPAITRPWIVPNEIIIRESAEGAYIYKATLKVMLEEDYLRGARINYGFNDPRLKELNEYSTQLIKESIIPKLTYEVNASKRYAPLRQVYYSLILAQWFKQKYGSFGSIRAADISARVNSYIDLIDSGSLANLTSSQPYDKQSYFQQYQKSFKDGEYNLQEPVYASMGQSIRRYVSGGGVFDCSSSINKGRMYVQSDAPMVELKYIFPVQYARGIVTSSPALGKLFKRKLFNNEQEARFLSGFSPPVRSMIQIEFLSKMRDRKQAVKFLWLLRNIKNKLSSIDEHYLINSLLLESWRHYNFNKGGVDDSYVEGLKKLNENLKNMVYRNAFLSLFGMNVERMNFLPATVREEPTARIFYPMASLGNIQNEIRDLLDMAADNIIIESRSKDGKELLKGIIRAIGVAAVIENIAMPGDFFGKKDKELLPGKTSAIVMTYNNEMRGYFELTLLLQNGGGRKKMRCYFGVSGFEYMSEGDFVLLNNIGLEKEFIERIPVGREVMASFRRYQSDENRLLSYGFVPAQGREGVFVKHSQLTVKEMRLVESLLNGEICFAPIFDPEVNLIEVNRQVEVIIGRINNQASSAVLNQPQQAFRQLMDTQAKSKLFFVCTGNRNRSSAMELLLKNSLKNNGVENIAVESGGTLLWEYITRFLWDIYERGNFRGSREEKLMKAIALDDDNLLNMPKPLSDEDRFNKEDIIKFYFNFNVRYWNDKISGLGRDDSTKDSYWKILNGFLKEVLLPSLDKSIKEYQMYLKNNLLELYIDDKIDGGLPSDFKFGKIVTPEAIKTATVIIAADKYNKELIKENFPGVKDNIFLFNELAPDAFPGRVNVPDPQAGEIDMLGMIQGIERGIENSIIPLLKNVKAQKAKVAENKNEENSKPIEAKEFLTKNSVAILKIVEKINNNEKLVTGDEVLLMRLSLGLRNSGGKFSRFTFYDGKSNFRWRKGDVFTDGRNFFLILEDREDGTVKEAKVMPLSDIPGSLSIKEVRTMQIIGLNQSILLIEENVGKLLKERFFSASSSAETQKNDKDLGGIALNSLPIQVHAGSGVSSALTSAIKPLSSAEMEAEWAQMQAMVNSAIRPSPERLERYAVSANSSLDYSQARDRLIGLFADILRNDETNQRQPLLEPALKNILLVLENNT